MASKMTVFSCSFSSLLRFTFLIIYLLLIYFCLFLWVAIYLFYSWNERIYIFIQQYIFCKLHCLLLEKISLCYYNLFQFWDLVFRFLSKVYLLNFILNYTDISIMFSVSKLLDKRYIYSKGKLFHTACCHLEIFRFANKTSFTNNSNL